MARIAKHRAPSATRRQLPRLAGLVAVGATALASLGVAAPASAAAAPAPATVKTATSGNVWDRVAACESSGNWSINTGNGFYGGLQFYQPTWVGFGGQRYARYAHQASKSQQIAVAQRVLRVQGPGAWPVCSVRAGLTRTNGLAVSTTSSTGSRTSTAPSRTSSRSMAELVIDGKRGPLTTKAIQRWVGTYRDGIFGPITTRALQRKVGTVPDGIWGPKSQAALQDYLGIRRDGSRFMNYRTVVALQKYLNANVIR
ncbi:transglycosylase family protein [Ornithinicoccus halotolerans]|uniref:transglycosylase family protein n=1 Tax=Ornithinicoccus halotolerans TaxID=1748220 RepID=UPI001295347F|nr:transglycosylase family protein [Ornithinicoccus halotolerans]